MLSYFTLTSVKKKALIQNNWRIWPQDIYLIHNQVFKMDSWESVVLYFSSCEKQLEGF